MKIYRQLFKTILDIVLHTFIVGHCILLLTGESKDSLVGLFAILYLSIGGGYLYICILEAAQAIIKREKVRGLIDE